MGTLWNTYAFYVLYANIDKFNPYEYEMEYDKLSIMDKWIISKLNTLISTVDKNLENYRITESARALQAFVDDLSNWYVRRSRERFWQKDMTQDKINAYMTLHHVLVQLSILAAPFVPFITEEIYRNLVVGVNKDAPESVHLCEYPVANNQFIDTELENNMDRVLKLVVMGRACRNASNIKNRQPVACMYVTAGFELDEIYRVLVEDELNLKEVIFTEDASRFIKYKFKPQLKTVGPKYGKLVGQISKALAEINDREVMEHFKKGESIHLNIGGTDVELSESDVLIETAQKEGFISETDRDIAVVLDTNLTPELIEEGFIREIISKIQTMRKEANFDVQDYINLYVEGNEKIEALMVKNQEFILNEVLSESIKTGELDGYKKEWNINGEQVWLAVKKA